MTKHMIIFDPRQGASRTARPASREDYFTSRRPDALHGRLGFSIPVPRVVGCEIFELSDNAAYVEAYMQINTMPEIFTLEIEGQYHRARLLYAEGRRLRLEFFDEDLDYIETV